MKRRSNMTLRNLLIAAHDALAHHAGGSGQLLSALGERLAFLDRPAAFAPYPALDRPTESWSSTFSI
jgi:hypothetical protein